MVPGVCCLRFVVACNVRFPGFFRALSSPASPLPAARRGALWLRVERTTFLDLSCVSHSALRSCFLRFFTNVDSWQGNEHQMRQWLKLQQQGCSPA